MHKLVTSYCGKQTYTHRTNAYIVHKTRLIVDILNISTIDMVCA